MAACGTCGYARHRPGCPAKAMGLSRQIRWQRHQREHGRCIICGARMSARDPTTGRPWTRCRNHRSHIQRLTR